MWGTQDQPRLSWAVTLPPTKPSQAIVQPWRGSGHQQQHLEKGRKTSRSSCRQSDQWCRARVHPKRHFLHHLVGEDPTSAASEPPPCSQLPQIWHSSSAQGHFLHLNGQEPYPQDEGGWWEGSVPALAGMAGGQSGTFFPLSSHHLEHGAFLRQQTQDSTGSRAFSDGSGRNAGNQSLY